MQIYAVADGSPTKDVDVGATQCISALLQ